MILGFIHQVQLSVFVKAIGMGYFLGVIFSVCIFFNALGGKNTFLVFLRDILFFTVSAILTFMFALKYNSGMLRFYIIAGELIGFILFYIFPGRLSGNFWRKIFSPVRNALLEKKKNITLKLSLSKSRLSEKIRKFTVKSQSEKQNHEQRNTENFRKKKKGKTNKKYAGNLKKITKNT